MKIESLEYYKTVFEAAEHALIQVGIQSGTDDIQQQLGAFKAVAAKIH
jgi:hypothetical protein